VDQRVSIDLDDAQRLRDGHGWENRWQLPGALETFRVFYELDNEFMNALGARERVKMGLLASDSFKMLQKPTKSGQPTGGVLQGFLRKNPASR